MGTALTWRKRRRSSGNCRSRSYTRSAIRPWQFGDDWPGFGSVAEVMRIVEQERHIHVEERLQTRLEIRPVGVRGRQGDILCLWSLSR